MSVCFFKPPTKLIILLLSEVNGVTINNYMISQLRNQATISAQLAKHSLERRKHNSSAHFYEKRHISAQLTSHTQNVRDKHHSLTRNPSRIITDPTISPQEQPNRHFGRITMHCLRKKREDYERQAQSLQSQYSFLLKRIEKLQREKESQEHKDQWKREIRNKKQHEQSFLHSIKTSNDCQLERRKQELREQVLSHRFQKLQSVLRSREEKLQIAQEQRSKEEQLHEQLCMLEANKLQLNKSRCRQQKQAKVSRHQRMKTQLQVRKYQAKSNFQQKWTEQYQREQNAKQHYLTKKSQLEQKMRHALQFYNDLMPQ